MSIPLHILPRIHVLIAAYGWLMVYVFVIVGLAIVPVFEANSYFSIGAPVTVQADPTRDIQIHDNALFVAICLLLGADQYASVVLAEARLESTTPPSLLYEVIDSFTRNIRVAVHIVFMRSQISFVAALVLFDLIATVTCKWAALRHKQARVKDAPSPFSHITDSAALLLSAASIMVFLAIYVAAGLFDSAYTRIAPPLLVFDQTQIVHEAHYWTVIVAVFCWALLASAAKNNTDTWHASVLHNTAHAQTGLSAAESRAIILNRVVVYYVGAMFLYTFVTTQFFFVVVFAIAEAVAHIVHRLRQPISLADNRTSIIIIAIAQTLFELIVVIVVVVSHWFDDEYFTWGEGVTIFGVPVPMQRHVSILLVYAAFERGAAVLDTNVVQADLTTWLYEGAANEEIESYGFHTIVALVVSSRLSYWFYFVLRIQFILTNYAFVVVCAAVEFLALATVGELHLAHKQHVRQRERVIGFWERRGDSDKIK